MMTLLIRRSSSSLFLAAAVLSAACGVSSPTAPSSSAPPAPAAPAPALTELEAYHEPLEVYAGSSTQVHVGTFARMADGSLRAVYDVPCTFATDGGVMTDAPAGTDTSWHVVVVSVPKAMGGQPVHVRAACGALTAAVSFTVIPEGVLPPRPSPPGAGVGTPPGAGVGGPTTGGGQ